MRTTYTFTLRKDDQDIQQTLGSLPSRQRSKFIRDAIRAYNQQQQYQAPSILQTILDEIRALKAVSPPKDDENTDGVLFDLSDL